MCRGLLYDQLVLDNKFDKNFKFNIKTYYEYKKGCNSYTRSHSKKLYLLFRCIVLYVNFFVLSFFINGKHRGFCGIDTSFFHLPFKAHSIKGGKSLSGRY